MDEEQGMNLDPREYYASIGDKTQSFINGGCMMSPELMNFVECCLRVTQITNLYFVLYIYVQTPYLY